MLMFNLLFAITMVTVVYGLESCARNKGGCEQMCTQVSRRVQCSCNRGYILDIDLKSCRKLHLCDTGTNGGCEQVCVKDGEKAVCTCGQGYRLNEDGKSCMKIHPCDTGTNGGCEQVCVKDGDKAVCACNQGYRLSEDGKSCDKVKLHPCDTDANGGCQQLCVKDGGKAVCSCGQGFRLNEDGKSCIKIKKEKPLIPCKDGWSYFERSQICIKAFRDKRRTWHQARDNCKAQGGDLVAIPDATTWEFVKGLMGKTRYWIGLHDEARDGKFKWLDEKEETKLSVWRHKPLNHLGNEYCAELIGNHGGQWNDKPCSFKRNSMCQMGTRSRTPEIKLA